MSVYLTPFSNPNWYQTTADKKDTTVVAKDTKVNKPADQTLQGTDKDVSWERGTLTAIQRATVGKISTCPQQEISALFTSNISNGKGTISYNEFKTLSSDAKKMFLSKLNGQADPDINISKAQFLESIENFQESYWNKTGTSIGSHGRVVDRLIGIKTFTAMFCNDGGQDTAMFSDLVRDNLNTNLADDQKIAKNITPQQMLAEVSRLTKAEDNYKPDKDFDLAGITAGDSSGLGRLSAKYESKGPGDISNTEGDYGGISYGTYQFTRKSGSLKDFVLWLKSHNTELYTKLSGNYNNITEFNKLWKAEAGSNRDTFAKLQDQYTMEKFFLPFGGKLKTSGFDISQHSIALQQAAWSTVVQHGVEGAAGIFRKILNQNPGATDETLIKAVYDERGRTDQNGELVHFKNSSGKVQQNVAHRFVNEKRDALHILQATGPGNVNTVAS